MISLHEKLRFCDARDSCHLDGAGCRSGQGSGGGTCRTSGRFQPYAINSTFVEICVCFLFFMSILFVYIIYFVWKFANIASKPVAANCFAKPFENLGTILDVEPVFAKFPITV